MLIDTKGKQFLGNIPKDRKAREALLAPLREVLRTRPAHGKMFSLEARARLVQGK